MIRSVVLGCGSHLPSRVLTNTELAQTVDTSEDWIVQRIAASADALVANLRPHATERMGIGPVPATRLVLQRAGLSLKDLDLFELNEAFAAQVLACTYGLEFQPGDYDRLNVNGSGISLGHPVGATGVRILATMLRELDRRGGRYALETMCIGGGQGLAAVFERVG